MMKFGIGLKRIVNDIFKKLSDDDLYALALLSPR